MSRLSADRVAVRGTATGHDHLFVYGTLMVPRIFAAVCGTVRPQVLAELAGHARYRVRGAVFPGLVPEAGARTAGCLVSGIDAALWQRLDAFEGDLYERCEVKVRLLDGRECAGMTYVVTAAGRSALTRQRWSLAAFERRHLEAYLARWTMPPAATITR